MLAADHYLNNHFSRVQEALAQSRSELATDYRNNKLTAAVFELLDIAFLTQQQAIKKQQESLQEVKYYAGV